MSPDTVILAGNLQRTDQKTGEPSGRGYVKSGSPTKPLGDSCLWVAAE